MPSRPDTSSRHKRAGRLTWALFIIFVFVAFQCVLFAVVRQGEWFILLAPGAVCGAKAWQLWMNITGKGRGAES